jgi:hypothetical protein
MIRWEQQASGEWHGYSGELIVAMVAEPPEGARRQWLWEVAGVERPHGWRSSGHRASALAARRAADQYWERWCAAAALRPDLERLAKSAQDETRRSRRRQI